MPKKDKKLKTNKKKERLNSLKVKTGKESDSNLKNKTDKVEHSTISKPSTTTAVDEKLSTRTKTPRTRKTTQLSEKDLATKNNEPWVKVISLNVDENNPGDGVFELDWNDIFVARLVKAGFTGKTDVDIVDQWFKQVCTNIAEENFEQWEANFPNLSPRRRDNNAQT